MTERVLALQFDEAGPKRLDHYLVSQIPEHSRSYLQGLIKNGLVRVDGVIVKKSGIKLEACQVIEVKIPPPEPSDLIPEDIPLNIIYEDNNVLVVNKAAGMVVHPSAGHRRSTLVHAVLAHAPNIEGVGGVKRPGLVHRLDKDTSGTIILAKNNQTHRFLQDQFEQREVEKFYLALVDGKPPTPEGRVEAAVGRDSIHRQRMAIVSVKKGRMAVSEYSTKEGFSKHTLLEVKILTGRTHQIRLHMAFIKCPVVGDVIYGHKTPTIQIERQFLHAVRLKILLPGQSSPKTFEVSLPEELANILVSLRL